MRRLAIIEDRFDALPFDSEAARECGKLHAAVTQRGGRPRRRAFDLAIAATACVNRVPLLTYNSKDFEIIDDLVDVRSPS
jgi:predicted nucleic acid-binding protein